MRRLAALTRLSVVIALAIFLFRSYFGTMLPSQYQYDWLWVTVSAISLSIFTFSRSAAVVADAIKFSSPTLNFGPLVVVLGAGIFFSGSLQVLGSGQSSLWLQLIGSIISAASLIWSAFGAVVTKVLLSTILPLALILPPPFVQNYVSEEWVLALALGFLLLAVLIELRLSPPSRGVLGVMSASSVVLTGALGLQVAPLVATSFLILAGVLMEALGTDKGGIMCQTCGDLHPPSSRICTACSAELLSSTRSGSLAPLVFSAAFLLLAGSAVVPLVSLNPNLTIQSYSLNGKTALPIVDSPTGWIVAQSNLSSAGNATSATLHVANSNLSTALDVSMAFHPARGSFSNQSSGGPPGRPVASGYLNGTQTIRYSVYQRGAQHQLVLSWGMRISSRNSTGPNEVFGLFTVQTSSPGTFNRSSLQGELSSPSYYSNWLNNKWMSFSSWTFLVNSTLQTWSLVGDYTMAFAGATVFFVLAAKARRSEKSTVARISNMRNLSEDEKSLFVLAMDDGQAPLFLEMRKPGGIFELSKVYSLIGRLREKDLLRIRTVNRKRRLLVRVTPSFKVK